MFIDESDMAECKQVKEKHQDEDDIECYIRRLPKIELHVHLEGSFDSKVLMTYLQTAKDCFKWLPENTILPWDGSIFPVRKLVQACRNHEDLFQLCTCRGKRSFYEMFKCFEIFVPIVRGNLALLEQLAHEFCKRQKNENIIYTEVRYSPHILAEGGSYSKSDNDIIVDANPVIDAITRGLRSGQREFGIQVNQILCCLSCRPDWADDIVRIASERRHEKPCAVVGIDIAAGEDHFDESKFPDLYKPHFEAFQKAKQLKLNVSLHAGEVGNVTNITRAVEYYGAVRIGHGYQIVENKEVLEKFKNSKIHFETCPSSSLETGAWKGDDKGNDEDWKQHPCMLMLSHGLNIGFNTDNPAVFDTSLTNQLRIAAQGMGIEKDRLVQIMYNCIDAAFVNDGEKKKLRIALKDFEKKGIF